MYTNFTLDQLKEMAADHASMRIPAVTAKWNINETTMRYLLKESGLYVKKPGFNIKKSLSPENQTTARLMAIEGKGLNAIAKATGSGRAIVKRDLIAAGIWKEDTAKTYKPREEGLPLDKKWDEGISNKYLIMKLRSSHV